MFASDISGTKAWRRKRASRSFFGGRLFAVLRRLRRRNGRSSEVPTAPGYRIRPTCLLSSGRRKTWFGKQISQVDFTSPVAADHKVFFVSEAGIVSVVKAVGDWEILQINKLNDQCYATPAIVDNKLYIRTRGTLYCFANQR
jgi:hypothetical protein